MAGFRAGRPLIRQFLRQQFLRQQNKARRRVDKTGEPLWVKRIPFATGEGTSVYETPLGSGSAVPPLTDEELDDLRGRHPSGRARASLYKNEVLDGRNRLEACRRAEVEPEFRVWDEEGSPLDYVIRENVVRRHLNATQRVGGS